MNARAEGRSAARPAADEGAVWNRSGSRRRNPEAEKLARLSYLIADGNRFGRSMLKDTLHGMGIRAIVEAEDPYEALAAARFADVVVVGYEMRDMGGVELTWRIRRNDDPRVQRIPVIMIGDHAGETLVRMAIDAGVNEFLPRPFSPGGLFTRIRRAVLVPKPFVVAANYIGPDRRLKDAGPTDGVDRRVRPPAPAEATEQRADRDDVQPPVPPGFSAASEIEPLLLAGKRPYSTGDDPPGTVAWPHVRSTDEL